MGRRVGEYTTEKFQAAPRRTGAHWLKLLLLSVLPAYPLIPLPAQQTSITIYNDGRVQVRRTLPVNLPRGQSVQRLPLGPLQPATLFSLDSAVHLERVVYDGATDEQSVLRRSVGKRLVFRLPESRDTISALVLGVDPLRLQLPDGRIMFAMPGIPMYPSDVVVAQPAAVLSLQSRRAQNQLRLGYFTTGASWRASYHVTLGRKEAEVSGLAVLASDSLTVENAQVHLLAGEVGRAEKPPEPPRPLMARAEAAEMRMADAVTQQRVGEFHLYSLPGTSTLLPGVTTNVALFEPPRVEYDREYVVHGDVPYWGFLPQRGEETDEPVEVVYTLRRPRKTEFGDRPLPGGVAHIYQPDSSGALQLVGEARVEHTPPGEPVRLLAGNAFDITAQRVQTSYSTRRDSTKAHGVHTVATAEYRVTVKNATDSAVTVLVQEERAGEWSVVASTVPPEKVSSTITRFRVRVPPRGETVLRYRIRVIW